MLYDFEKKIIIIIINESVDIHPNFELLGGVDINKRNLLFEVNIIYLALIKFI